MKAAATASVPSERVLTTIRGWIGKGQWRPGQKLPSEQRLATQLRVSRTTLRSALKRLEGEGVLRDMAGVSGRARGRVVASAEQAQAAAGLVARGVVVLTEPSEPVTPDDFGGLLKAADSGVLEAIRRHQLNVLFVNYDSVDEGFLDHLVADRPRGVILSARLANRGVVEQLGRRMERVVQADIPVVVGRAEPFVTGADRAVFDHDEGAYQLTRWLLASGRRRIARLWHPYPLARFQHQRDQGCERALREAGLEPLAPVVMPDFNALADPHGRRSAYAGFVLGCLHAGADAILAINDQDSYVVAAACQLLGRDPARDLTIVGYDHNASLWLDLHALAPGFHPAATIDKQNHLAGTEMVGLLLDRIEGRLPPTPQTRLIPPKLIAGAAVGGAAAKL